MIDFIQRLPIDIVLRIIPYTYGIQDKTLLRDIANYKETRTLLLGLYHTFWKIQMQEEGDEDKNWLINDIMGYANNHKATMYGYVDTFYNIFKRNVFLRSTNEIDKYVFNLDKKEVSSQINIILGLLTIEERKDFVNTLPIM